MTCVIYHGSPPPFPPSAQHPSARRHGPIAVYGVEYFVDCIGPPPTPDEIAAMLAGDQRAERVAQASPAAIGRAADTIATWREIAQAITERKERHNMSLTGCSEVAGLLRDDLKKVKERMREAFAKINAARGAADAAVEKAQAVAAIIEQEVRELESEFAQATNLPLSSPGSEDVSAGAPRPRLDDAPASNPGQDA